MLSLDTPVADLVIESSALAPVFDRYQIDYCCAASRTLRDACEDAGVDPAKLAREHALELRRRTPPTVDPHTLSTPELITLVIAPHHQYLHHALPALQRLATRVARMHADATPRLRELARAIDVFATQMIAHLDEEERMLFPTLLAGDVEEALRHLATMEAEHVEVEAALARLRALADDYVAPAWACTRYRALLAELAYLEVDTLRHAHVESHVLRPRFVRP